MKISISEREAFNKLVRVSVFYTAVCVAVFAIINLISKG